MKTLDSYNFEDKKVLLRVDLNSDVVNGKIIENQRFKAHAETIKELKKKKAKIIILAHQGRPKQKDFTSLRRHSVILSKYVKVKFVEDVVGKKALNAIDDLKKGEVILLDNIRELKDEFNSSSKSKFVKTLSSVCDIYVNNAFSVCHRAHASVVGFPKVMKHCAGRIIEKELKVLKKIHLGKTLFILGGAKPKDDILLLNNKRRILSCGLFGQVCLISKGVNFGAQNKFLKNKLEVVNKLKIKLKNVEFPFDFAVKANGKRKELNLIEFPSKYEIFDIGKETIKDYNEKIKNAHSIFMKGPAGHFSMKGFDKGTKEILKAVEKSKGYSLVGGGQLSNAVAKYKIKVDHVSLSGGALIDYVAGKKLVGIEALR